MARAIPLNELPVFSRARPPEPGFDFASGAAFLLNKPKGKSSFDMVRLLRKCLDIRKIGHAGTLDPMATGLLILCCGRGTKTIEQFQSKTKEYVGEITFGASTPSYDAETEIEEEAPTAHISENTIREALDRNFSGEITQLPPMYSAVKHKGTRLYKLARKGKEVKRRPRIVVIHETRIMEFDNPVLKLYVKCGKGTYIRSIAHDLGKALDSLGHLTALERTAIGEYRSEQALAVQDLKDIFEP